MSTAAQPGAAPAAYTPTYAPPAAADAPAPGAPAPGASAPGAVPTLDLHDIQGNVLRGYRAGHARHLVLRIDDAAGARAFLGGLVSGDHRASPQLTTASHWAERPTYFLNVALTADGLRALGLPEPILARFPDAYRLGPARVTPPTDPFAPGVDIAATLGDTEASAPANWEVGGPDAPPAHLVVSVHTGYRDEHAAEHMEAVTGRLRALFAAHGLAEVHCLDAHALPDGTVHFGFRDGIGQPRIEGTPGRAPHDMQPPSRAGEFLLGRDHVNQYGGNFLGSLPNALGDNATYAVLRVVKQDVEAFERFIERAGAAWNLDPELVAAKLMGRWRNGKPLTLAPTTDATPVPESRIDAYDYAPTSPDPGPYDDPRTPPHPTYYDDADGLRCPIGAHARRMNPRGARVMGKPHSRRIIRRGLPYGPAYNPATTDHEERGLMGYLICGDIEMQFEFLQSAWANGDFATSGIRGTRDPIIGTQPPSGGMFVIRTDDGRDPIILTGLPQLVETKGTLYTFMPGVGGVRWLARAAWEEGAGAPPA